MITPLPPEMWTTYCQDLELALASTSLMAKTQEVLSARLTTLRNEAYRVISPYVQRGTVRSKHLNFIFGAHAGVRAVEWGIKLVERGLYDSQAVAATYIYRRLFEERKRLPRFEQIQGFLQAQVLRNGTWQLETLPSTPEACIYWTPWRGVLWLPEAWKEVSNGAILNASEIDAERLAIQAQIQSGF